MLTLLKIVCAIALCMVLIGSLVTWLFPEHRRSIRAQVSHFLVDLLSVGYVALLSIVNHHANGRAHLKA